MVSRILKHDPVSLAPLGLLSLNLGGRALSQALGHSSETFSVQAEVLAETLFQLLWKGRPFPSDGTPVPESKVVLASPDLVKNRPRVIGHSFWWRDLTLLHTGILFLCVLRGIPTHRSWVRKIRFAPGKGNQKLIAMYSDGAEVWDTKEVGSAPGGALQPSCIQELYSSPSLWCRNEACVMGWASFSKPFSRF